MANVEVQRLLISFPVRGMMSRGDYIYFNIMTTAVALLAVLTLNSVAKSLTSDLPPGFQLQESDASQPSESDLTAPHGCGSEPNVFSEDITEVNYV